MNDNNESKVIKKLMKKDFNKLGITLVMQELIANGIILIVAIGICIMQMVTCILMTITRCMSNSYGKLMARLLEQSW